MGIIQTGDWQKFQRGIQMYHNRSQNTRTTMVKKAAVIGQKTIKENLQSGGSLVGSPFTANSDVTVALKGSSKPLIDSGAMMGSVATKLIDAETSFAGVLKQSEGGVNLGALHEKGTNRAGRGNKVTIPARPWITPVAESQILKDRVTKMAEAEMEDLIKGLFA